MRCTVKAIGRTTAIGFTLDNKRVLISLRISAMRGLRKNDVVEFDPEPARPPAPGGRPCDFFARNQRIIPSHAVDAADEVWAKALQ